MSDNFTIPFRVVLCRTEGPGNLGAVCRAMKTMGITDLALVDPSPGALDPSLVREMALHAFDLFEQARSFPTLEEALADCCGSAAFARRQGNQRKTGFFELPEFRKMMEERPGSAAPVALVFGNEKHGLNTQEVEACTWSVQIPTHPDFPSLNLAQAVQIACWELRQLPRALRAPQTGSRSRMMHPQTQGQNGAAAEELVEAFTRLGFYSLGGRAEALVMWRDLLTRAGINREEAAWLKGTFGKLRGLKSAKPPRPSDQNPGEST